MKDEKGWSPDNYAHGNVRVYPSLFPRHRPGDWTEHEEYIATEVRFEVGTHRARKTAKGDTVRDPNSIVISAVDPNQEELMEIELSASDAERLWRTLTYCFVGTEGLSRLEGTEVFFPENKDAPDEEPRTFTLNQEELE
jgi:hypothetical protein